MTWDSVPWFVGGGAEHSPEVARLVAYTAFGGAEGIVGAEDLRVRALDVPGPSVRVLPGACAILSRALGGAYQAYAGRLPTEDTVAIAATGSSGGRSDLIVARVEDPFMAGEPWAGPADARTGPYIFTRVIPNVSPTTESVEELGLGYSALALARVDLPANTGTVTDAMLTDLRAMARPRSSREMKTPDLVANETLGSPTSYTNFPAQANTSVRIPAWASLVHVRADLQGCAVGDGDWHGDLRVRISGGGATIYTDLRRVMMDHPGTGWDPRHDFGLSDSIYVPPALRGQTASVSFEARSTYRENTAAYFGVDANTHAVLDFDFVEDPLSYTLD